MSTVSDTSSPDEPRVESHTDQPDGATPLPLATQIKEIDTVLDSRDCPHECHGTLSVVEASDVDSQDEPTTASETVADGEDRVLCESCRCTPSGTYVPPAEDPIEHRGQGLGVPFFYPRGFPVQKQEDRDRYSHSENVILPGGHEAVYDESHPAGEGDEYTWDVSTL